MMGMKAFLSTFTAVACYIMLFNFAGSEVHAAQPKGAAPAAAPAVQKETVKEGAYEYSGLDRRDPFAPLVSKHEGGRGKGIAPLETYDVTEMKVIAILWDKNKYYAVVSLPDGKSYSVAAGSKVGTRNGVVTKITKDNVVVRERVRDARGVFGPQDTVLRLRGEEEE